VPAVDKRIVFVGAGAVGGYVGGHVARAGHDVTLIDPWPEHIDCIKREGIHLGGTQGEHRVRVKALHITEVQQFVHAPADIAFICVKLYDTAWASALIKPYLAPGGIVVTLQNALVEETVARIVGWGRTLGCIASTISVEAIGPGHIVRTQLPGGSAYTVFRVGEMSGSVTARAEEVAQLLRAVDSARVTGNLWGERWSKLVANCMTTGICGASGLDLNQIIEHEPARRLQIRLAAEAIRIGTALGFELEPIRGLAAAQWLAAATGDAATVRAVEKHLLDGVRRRPEGGRSGTAQDLAKGRRTEVDFMNGYVAATGEEIGIPAPTHAAITAIVKCIERGELKPDPQLLSTL
jgi:2-dehydropantoate 2-reductase